MPANSPDNQNRSISFPDVRDSDIVFDMDGTILNGDLGESVFFLLHINDNHEEAVSRYVSYFKSNAYGDAYRLTAQTIADYSPEFIRNCAKQVLDGDSKFSSAKGLDNSKITIDKYVFQIGATVRPEIERLILELRHRGARMWIVSASPQPVVEACGEILGIQQERIFGATTDKEGERITRFPWKGDKVKTLKDAGVLNPLIVFGNGIEDFNMLQIAEKPVVVADAHEELIKFAKRRNWDIFGANTLIEWE